MKIIWSIDAFDKDPTSLRRMAGFLKAFCAKKGDTVQAAYVASPGETRLATAFDVPAEIRFSQYPRSLIHRHLAKTVLPLGKDRIKILEQDHVSKRAAVQTLVEYAEGERADFIALFTRSRTGLNKLLLGSFAEPLAHQSSVSLLALNPKMKISGRPKRLFYAAELGAEGEDGFQETVHLAKRLGAELVIYHAPQPWLPYGLVEEAPSDDDHRQERKKELDALARLANEEGVKAKAVLDKDFSAVAPSIVKQAARAKADAIVVTSRRGRVASFLLGSVTRDLLRTSPLPLIILKL